MELVIKYLPIEKIIPYENNPRHIEAAVPYVAESIKEFGFKNPVILSKDNVIIAGHTRIKAAEELGIKEVPCIYAEDLTDEQIKAYRLVDNKVAEIAIWDFERLEQELETIEMDMENFGFDLPSPVDLEDYEPEEKESNTIQCHCPKCGFYFEVER